MVADPEPLVDPETLIQSGRSEMLQAHPALVVIVRLTFPPSAGAWSVVEERE
jgi:hypothetical protein